MENKIVSFIHDLTNFKQKEIELSLLFANDLSKQLSESDQVKQLSEIQELIDKFTKNSYQHKEITLSHQQFTLLNEILYHLGCVNTLELTIKEMNNYFNLKKTQEISLQGELNNKHLVNFDVKDYSNFPRKFQLIIGGMAQEFDKSIQEECTKLCLASLLKYLNDKDIKIIDNGFIIQTATQNIPDIIKQLALDNIGVYGVIPL